MALAPRIRHLSSPLEDEARLPQEWEETAWVESLSGSPGARWLYRWAEYHQRQFGEKISQQGLTATDVGILHGETLRAGSAAREYQGYIESLEARTAQTFAWNMWREVPFPTWIFIVWQGCTLMAVCQITGQICYNGIRAVRN